jgi:Cu2+-exporting ATPase
MKKQFKVEGMSCGHCRASVERALNSIPDVIATVTLTPPAATVEFSGAEVSPHDLQKAVSEAGDYKLVGQNG